MMEQVGQLTESQKSLQEDLDRSRAANKKEEEREQKNRKSISLFKGNKETKKTALAIKTNNASELKVLFFFKILIERKGP